MSGTPPPYPFVPKSNRWLAPGQYWAIPLADGRFACGRVMTVPAWGKSDRIGLVVGLTDWVGDHPPTGEDIKGAPLLAQAATRFEAIANTGGAILGTRPLDADGLVAHDPNDQRATHRVWGWARIKDLAQEAFAADDAPGWAVRPPPGCSSCR